MVEPHKRVSSHLEYYLTLSKDIENISRYIELCEGNYSVFSIELTRLILAIGSEVDVVAKRLCLKYEPEKNPKSINSYKEILLKHIPKITVIDVNIARYSLAFVPWETWSTGKNPDWWISYNNVKHHRHEFYREANLGNILNALAGLCVLICYLEYDEIEKGLNIRVPMMFLSSKYKKKGALLRTVRWKLPQK